jgi:hypothetical protein
LRRLHELDATTIVAGETGKLATWKPNVLLVQDEKLNEVEKIICPWPSHRESADGRHACTILDRTQKPRLQEILAVYSSGKDDKRNVFVFPAAEVSSFFVDLSCSSHLVHILDHKEYANPLFRKHAGSALSSTWTLGTVKRFIL